VQRDDNADETGATLNRASLDPMAKAPAPGLRAMAPQTSFPPRLIIELDEAAERFVQTLVDGVDVLRRYPDEAQLAFSRGVNAYMAALARR
jgi:hypothetical protein